jgi:hypothetical protein
MHVQHFFLFSLLIQEFYLRGQNRKEKVENKKVKKKRDNLIV